MDRLSDEDYLVATDLPILLNDLLKQINIKKPENPWQYSAIYFKKVQQCIHILGEDYLTIVSCRHNRRSFVYCCQQSFQHFSPTELISINDFYSLLQLICPDIPLSLIHDSAITGCISHTVDSNNPPPPSKQTNSSAMTPPLLLYTFEELSYSLYFRFIFTEWLIMIENLFFEGTTKTRKSSTTISIPISKLQSQINEWRYTLPITTSQPSSQTLNSIYNHWKQQNKYEITFDELIHNLLHNSLFKAETIAYQPQSRNSSTGTSISFEQLLSGTSILPGTSREMSDNPTGTGTGTSGGTNGEENSTLTGSNSRGVLSGIGMANLSINSSTGVLLPGIKDK